MTIRRMGSRNMWERMNGKENHGHRGSPMTIQTGKMKGQEAKMRTVPGTAGARMAEAETAGAKTAGAEMAGTRTAGTRIVTTGWKRLRTGMRLK